MLRDSTQEFSQCSIFLTLIIVSRVLFHPPGLLFLNPHSRSFHTVNISQLDSLFTSVRPPTGLALNHLRQLDSLCSSSSTKNRNLLIGVSISVVQQQNFHRRHRHRTRHLLRTLIFTDIYCFWGNVDNVENFSNWWWKHGHTRHYGIIQWHTCRRFSRSIHFDFF